MAFISHEYYGGGISYVADREYDPFLKLFTMGVVNQESCFTCPYRNLSSADIRLGDYWGKRYENSEEGVSMVIVNTLQGAGLMKAVEGVLCLEQHDMEERFSQQHTDYDYSKYYKKSLEMLRDDKIDFKDIIGFIQ